MKLIRQGQLKKDIVRHLYYRGGLSLAELSHLTGKSLPLVSGALSALVAGEYVVERGLAPSTGGRRPINYQLNRKKKKYIVAVAMDQLYTRIVVYDLLNNAVVPESRFSFPLADPASSIDALAGRISDVVRDAKVKPGQVLGVGIGMPGFINIDRGINESFLPVGEEEGNLLEALSRRLGLPVYIDNDSSAIAMAELHYGAARGRHDVMVVNVGWGIGLGMIVNGELFRGHQGYAGEFSHIPLSDSAKLCACGKRGCMEVEASLLVVLENAKAAMRAGATSMLERLFREDDRPEGDILLDAAVKGDPLAVTSLSDAASIIGKGLATLIHIMNPERIVLSGRGAVAGKILLAPVHRAINEFCIPKLAEQTEIVASELGRGAELLGAAILVMENCQLGGNPAPAMGASTCQ